MGIPPPDIRIEVKLDVFHFRFPLYVSLLFTGSTKRKIVLFMVNLSALRAPLLSGEAL